MSSAPNTASALTRLQHVYPKRLLSKIMFAATRIRFAPWKNWQIRWFISRYGVNMNEALETDPAAYPEFNTFFTRPLKSDARPMPADPSVLASPADGVVLERGSIKRQTMLQVKGLELNIHELLGENPALTRAFSDGHFATVYLSPRDYHRVHMPLGGRLRLMGHVPGELFSVSLPCVYGIPRLLARNERVISLFDTDVGPVAVILVGAVFVGSIETIWAGPVISNRRRGATWHPYDGGEHGLYLQRGQEMGRFNMGSTVITLFPRGTMRWGNGFNAGAPVSVGESMGTLTPDMAMPA